MMPKKFIKYNPELFAKGKRGLIYVFKKDNKKIAIKIKNPKSEAKDRIQNEAKFLKILNKYKIGPKIMTSGKDYFCYEFIEGKLLRDYLKENKNPEKVLKQIMQQCKILDKLKINKKEMHKPIKNIIIKKDKVILLDFERCYYAKKPHNVNQFKEFLRRFNEHKKFSQ
ncbi:serine/threonine protein kinase [Candidatus Woesearchaeota archaeon]|nr:serine/threonine protein kinase [Candidatus Woesearchaeota archaeon]